MKIIRIKSAMFIFVACGSLIQRSLCVINTYATIDYGEVVYCIWIQALFFFFISCSHQIFDEVVTGVSFPGNMGLSRQNRHKAKIY